MPESLKSDSHNAVKSLEAAQRAGQVMTSKGFQCLFEYIRPTIDSQDVYTLWVNFKEPFEMLTIADHQGGLSYYKLIPQFGYGDDAPSASPGQRGSE